MSGTSRRTFLGAVAIALVVVIGAGGLVWALGRVGKEGFVAPTAKPTPRVTSLPRATESPAATNLPSATPADPLAGEVLTIGISLPLTGTQLEWMDEIRAGVQLAVNEANERGLAKGYRIQTFVADHGEGDTYSTATAAIQMRALVDDPSTIAVVGPFHDDVARTEIPIANEAGLLQCSPANVAPDLTIGDGARGLRPRPDRVSYLRTQAPEDRTGLGMARFAWEDLGARRAVVADDGAARGRSVATEFAAEWERLGGTMDARFHTGGGLTKRNAAAIDEDTDVVVFGGRVDAGAVALRQAMDKAGLQEVPLVGGPDLLYGGLSEDAYLGMVSVAARDPKAFGETWAAAAYRSGYSTQASFSSSFKAKTGVEIGSFGAAAYACTQVILNAVRIAAKDGTVTREEVRAAATDPTTLFNGIFGMTSFDANGDIVPSAITIYGIARDIEGGPDWRWQRQFEFDAP